MPGSFVTQHELDGVSQRSPPVEIAMIADKLVVPEGIASGRQHISQVPRRNQQGRSPVARQDTRLISHTSMVPTSR